MACVLGKNMIFSKEGVNKAGLKSWDAEVIRILAGLVLVVVALGVFKSAAWAIISVFVLMFCRTRSDVKVLIYAGVLALTLRSLLFEPFHIPSGSMKGNLLIGDYLFVSKYRYGYSRYSFPLGLPLFEGRVLEMSKPQRGDVVVFRLPTDPKIDYIKRVIGLPGDTVQVREGILYINGAPLPRTKSGVFEDEGEGLRSVPTSIPVYTETLPEGKKIDILQERVTGFENNTGIYTVQPGHYFMMGDNRDNSRDSRFLDHVGYVPEENIIGRAELIFFSLDIGSIRGFKGIRWDRMFRLIH